jgi:hypothetical protein
MSVCPGEWVSFKGRKQQDEYYALRTSNEELNVVIPQSGAI